MFQKQNLRQGSKTVFDLIQKHFIFLFPKCYICFRNVFLAQLILEIICFCSIFSPFYIFIQALTIHATYLRMPYYQKDDYVSELEDGGGAYIVPLVNRNAY